MKVNGTPRGVPFFWAVRRNSLLCDAAPRASKFGAQRETWQTAQKDGRNFVQYANLEFYYNMI